MPNQPSSLNLTQLRRQIPKEFLIPPSKKNFLYFTIKLTLFLTSFILACSISNLFLSIPLLLLSGIFLFSLGTTGHDCGHGAHLRPLWLNELVGQICIVFHGMPYMGWKHSHNAHHAKTNAAEHDPDRHWLYPEEYYAKNPIERLLWRLFLTKLFFFNSFVHYIKSILPWAFIIHTKTNRKKEILAAYRDIAIFFVAQTLWQTLLFQSFGFKGTVYYLIALIVAFAGLAVYVRTQHHYLPNDTEYIHQPWVTSRTIIQHPILDFLVTNLNYHIEHHILQSISHTHLPKLRPIVKQILSKAGIKYNEENLFSFLSESYAEDFMIMNPETMLEMPLREYEQLKKSKPEYAQ